MLDNDALQSPLLDPLEGPSTLNCGKLGLEGRSRLPALKGGRGCARSLEIRLGRGTNIISFEFASKTNHKRVSSHSRTPLGVGTSHEQLDSLDSPRPGLERSHHLPPYSILYKWLFFPGLPRRSPETIPGWSPGTLGAHISRLQPPIGARSKPKL